MIKMIKQIRNVHDVLAKTQYMLIIKNNTDWTHTRLYGTNTNPSS